MKRPVSDSLISLINLFRELHARYFVSMNGWPLAFVNSSLRNLIFSAFPVQSANFFSMNWDVTNSDTPQAWSYAVIANPPWQNW